MKNRRQGFTLIELLAVILILGIIALIAIPTVNKVLEESKIGAFKSTVNNLTKKAEETCNLELIKGKGITRSYTIVDGELSKPLEIKGNIPDGEINVDNKCNVTYELTDNKYRAVKRYLSDDTDIIKCTKNCLSYNEPILNGAKPKLDGGMIPVTIGIDGSVKKADIYSNWYNYENQEWANVVLVTDESREAYKEAEAGSTITSTDILGYFVWIPRYKYRISTGGTTTPSSVDIVFENNMTPKSNGNAVDEYYSQPGFKFGDDELNGIWVAKFETTGTANAPTILPNAPSLRALKINSQFLTAIKFNDYIDNDNAHMMKNSEWGTVAYLSRSKYGINDEIRINNHSNFITGCGASEENAVESNNCQIEYGSNTEELPQSTTKNITGIFDMSGGSWETTMANFNNTISMSDFSIMPDSKYYDLYTSSNYENACNNKNCLGHALLETKNWYSDYFFNELNTTYSWGFRGGYYVSPVNAGIFSSDRSDGDAYSNASFRVVIS